jgi:hypothetical protein
MFWDKLINKILHILRACRRRIIHKLALDTDIHSIYGKIYSPRYNPSAPIDSQPPKIYNEFSQPMDLFFIRDIHGCHTPYLAKSKFFLWDRYNFGLDIHFYTHNCMLETMGQPKQRYGWLMEAESIVPNDYKIFTRHQGLEKDFDKIFTYSETILNQIPNAELFISCATIWYGSEAGCMIKMHDQAYAEKCKNISMICSNKIMCELHQLRHNFARSAQALGVAMFGQFNGGPRLQYKADSLRDYRYQIVIENDLKPYYFTEKIMDCFAAMTIPIYLGASKITNFFNAAGIIQITPNDLDKLGKILTTCNAQDYLACLAAVKDNYNRALNYRNLDDMLYRKIING